MKKTILLIILALMLAGCEEVIDLKLDSQEKQLVVDAALDWEKGQPARQQKIYLTYTSDYYASSAPEKARGAQVSVTTGKGNKNYVFTEQAPGEYICEDFEPELDEDYMLLINYQGKQYTAKDRMREAPKSEEIHITQREDGGFSGNEKELKITFQTKPEQDNSFVLKVIYPKNKKKETSVIAIDDKYFTDGRISFVLTGARIDTEFVKGDEIEITLYRVSAQYKQITDLFISSSLENSDGGPPTFTFPSRIYGNIVCKEDPKQNPLGAFRVAQYSKITYVIN